MRLTALFSMAGALALTAGCAPRSHVDTALPPVETTQDPRSLQLDRLTHEALERGIAAGKLAEGKVAYSVVLADNAAKFSSGRASLSADARQQLAALVDQLKSGNKDFYLEIQGHTDSVGPAQRNHRLALDRAKAVKAFLNSKGVALGRMATFSYGEGAPVASNDDAAGRAANRRVVIVVLS